MITFKDIQGAIAALITYQKAEFISAMNRNGYPISVGISNENLYDEAMKVFAHKGMDGIRPVLGKFRMDWSAYPENVKQKMFSIFGNSNQKCSWAKPLDCFTSAVNWAGDLLGGSATTITNPVTQQQTSESALSPAMLGLIVAGGLIGIMIFRKFIGVVVGIIVIVLAAVLYGLFAKKISTTVSGGGSTTESHGGIGSALLGLLGL